MPEPALCGSFASADIVFMKAQGKLRIPLWPGNLDKYLVHALVSTLGLALLQNWVQCYMWHGLQGLERQLWRYWRPGG